MAHVTSLTSMLTNRVKIGLGGVSGWWNQGGGAVLVAFFEHFGAEGGVWVEALEERRDVLAVGELVVELGVAAFKTSGALLSSTPPPPLHPCL
jgi:hypothetical protein